MGDISRALAEPITHTIGGKAYKFAPWSKRLQGQFEDWLEALAFDAAARRRRQLGEEKYDSLLARINEAIVGGTYAITGQIAQKKLRTDEGLVRLLCIVLGPYQPDMSEDDVRSMLATNAPEMIAAINRLMGKAGGAATATATPTAPPAQPAQPAQPAA